MIGDPNGGVTGDVHVPPILDFINDVSEITSDPNMHLFLRRVSRINNALYSEFFIF